ncbi:Protein transport inhibitor response 1 [Vitis vinifera]|uniref:Protein transport inhibitor response 1 n=1 Tax=Vitis vinifera TaxID=29760 RepID=A0A438C9E5_VITVI|nr:Protein transport inhibitor response 1 [Vitis vinifera]
MRGFFLVTKVYCVLRAEKFLGNPDDGGMEFQEWRIPGKAKLGLYSFGSETVSESPSIVIAAIATHCKNMTELDIQENGIDDLGGGWLSCFPENFTSLEVPNFVNLSSDVSFDAFEKLVSRCRSLKFLKVNKNITLEQLQRLLECAPQLTELGTGPFHQELTTRQYAELESAFNNCKNLNTLSGLWEATPLYLSVLYPACMNLTFLNLSDVALQSGELAKLLAHCPNLQRLWVLDTVEDKGLEAVGSSCPLLEELRVFPADPYEQDVVHGVIEMGNEVFSMLRSMLADMLVPRLKGKAVRNRTESILQFSLFDAPSRLTESRDQSEKHLEFPMAPLGTWTCWYGTCRQCLSAALACTSQLGPIPTRPCIGHF